MTEATLPDWTIRSGMYTARGSRRGAVLNSWTIRDGHHSHHLLDGYTDVSHLNTLDGCRNALLVPWSNRIHDARYTFDGVEYDFGLDEHGMRHALHGLAYMRDWEILNSTDSSVTLAITVGGIDAYPFRIALLVTYRVDGPNLFMEMEATNQGDTAAPVGMGWHPYFAHEGDWTVTLPARQKVLVDEHLDPLPEPFVEVEDPVVLHNEKNVDTAYTALSSNTATINNGTYEIEMTYTGSRHQSGIGVFHVYTGEGLNIRPGQSVAVEPCEFMADAYNRPELAEALRLEPAHSRMFTVQLTVSETSGEVTQ